MKVYLSGGAKNGKSSLAQELAVHLANGRPHYYVATMIPADSEDRRRIERHVADRAGMGFETIECGHNIASVTDLAGRDSVVLLDSVTALLLNELFADPASAAADETAARRVAAQLIALCDWFSDVIFVSDYIFSDAERYDGLTECFRRSLAAVDRALAHRCDVVAELCGGNITVHKGALPL